MNVVSTFSGVGGMDLGLARAGWRHLSLCEKDDYRRAVLAERFPGVPVSEDVREVAAGGGGRPEPGVMGGEPDRADGGRRRAGAEDGDARPDLLCGGFPCQDLSVAGRRRGLAGERSGLFFEFARVADVLRPRWLLIENVPGLLSSHGGRDFGELLGALADLGYGVGWRILDSRFFGVPQRRRRVFIVGCDLGGRLGAERAGEVLAVGSGCGGHPAEGGEAGARVAASLTSGSHGAGVNAPGRRKEDDVNLVSTAPTLVKRYAKGTDSDATDALIVNALDRMAGGPDDNDAQGGRLVPTGFHLTQDPIHLPGASLPLGHKSAGNGVQTAAGVRRLTPTECERLQGFPDGWTAITYQGKPAADSRRYAALGDAVTVPVAEWIGRRLSAVLAAQAAAA